MPSATCLEGFRLVRMARVCGLNLKAEGRAGGDADHIREQDIADVRACVYPGGPCMLWRSGGKVVASTSDLHLLHS